MMSTVISLVKVGQKTLIIIAQSISVFRVVAAPIYLNL